VMFPESLRDVATEAEVVASMLLSARNADAGLEALEAADFSDPDLRRIFGTIAALRVDDEEADAVSVRRRLKGDQSGASAAERLLSLPSGVLPPGTHRGALRDLRIKRDLWERLESARAELEAGGASSAVGDTLAADIHSVLESPRGSSFDGDAQAAELARAISELENSPDGVVGLRTGLRDLDRVLCGLRPEQLLLIGARPAQGKSALALSIAENVARAGVPVLVFSIEMSVRQMVLRRVAMATGLSRGALARGQFDRAALRIAEDQIRALPLRLEALADPSVAQIVARMKAEHSRGRLGLAIVDYLGLVRSDARAGTRNDEVAKMSRALKMAARSLGVPIILLSQFNRNVDHRENKAPSLADFRDSGQVEADADVAIGIHAPNAENIDPAERSKVDLVVLKNRDGRVGRVPVFFDHERTLFRDRVEPSTEWTPMRRSA